MFSFAPAAHAVPDGDLRPYLERFEPLRLDWPATGTVTSEWGPRWGRMHLGIDVGDGYSVLYAHFSSIAVKPGQWVNTGDLLGMAGCTGSCTGTHLHFELRKDGQPLDPAAFMRADNVG